MKCYQPLALNIILYINITTPLIWYMFPMGHKMKNYDILETYDIVLNIIW